MEKDNEMKKPEEVERIIKENHSMLQKRGCNQHDEGLQKLRNVRIE